MRVLVTAASKHGATMQIAQVIAAAISDRGLVAEARPVEEVATLAPYDAVVLGSAMYFGKWLKPAVTFANRHLHELSTRPVWLFSSGPVEEPSALKQSVRSASPVADVLTPQAHRVFGGALDKSRLGLHERALVRMVGARYGDFRDWEDVRAWGSSIATSLGATTPTPE